MPKAIDFENQNVDVRRLLLSILIAVVIVSAGWGSFFLVQPGQHAVEFNSATGALRESNEGLHLKVPFFESVVKYETRGQLYKATAEGASRDLQVVKAEVAVLYHPDLGSIRQIHLELGPDYGARVIAPSIFETVKATTAKHNATALIEDRILVKQEIESALRQALEVHHIVVEQVSITDFDFSDEFNVAIEAKVVAQQEAERANNTLARVAFESQQRVINASADLEAANKTAQATVVLAQANATAVMLVQHQFGTVESFLEWLKLRAWDGQLPRTLVMGNQTAGASGGVLLSV